MGRKRQEDIAFMKVVLEAYASINDCLEREGYEARRGQTIPSLSRQEKKNRQLQPKGIPMCPSSSNRELLRA